MSSTGDQQATAHDPVRSYDECTSCRHPRYIHKNSYTPPGCDGFESGEDGWLVITRGRLNLLIDAGKRVEGKPEERR